MTVPCLNPEFPPEQLKNYHARKIFEPLRGPTIWRVMQRNVWNDIVTSQTRRPNNSTKYLLHAPKTTTSKKKKWNLLENCLKYVLGTNWKTWYSMVSEQTCALDRKMDQNLWQTIISFHLLHSSCMWVQTVLPWRKVPNIADWDCFKTPILREILRIQNPLLDEHCAFLKSCICSKKLDV